MEDINRTIEFLTGGVPDIFAELQENDKIGKLMNGLKKEGFIDKNTRLEDFRVLFGIPLREEYTPFIPVRWIGSKILLYFFLKELFPKKCFYQSIFIVPRLFVNRYNDPCVPPQTSLKKIIYSKGYYELCTLLNNYNKRTEIYSPVVDENR